jgi:signal peptidase II
MSKRRKIILFFTCSFAFIAGDRITKDLAKTHLQGKETLTYFHDTFRLMYVENTGAALSLGDNLPKAVSFWLLSILPLVFLFGVAIYTIKHLEQMSAMKIFSLAMIFSGGIGNVIDRIVFDRHVTDFMNIGIGDIRTGIFNVADIFVTSGVIGLLLFFKDKNKTEIETGQVPVE